MAPLPSNRVNVMVAPGMARLDDVATRPDTLKLVAPPACMIVKVWFSTVKDPVRAAPGFASTAKVTVPLAVPLTFTGKVIQLSLLDALHEHPAPAITFTVPVPPEAGGEALEGEIE